MECAKTPWYSWKAGPLCEGCKMCVEGKKLVLFITGLCAQRCFYCPVSEQKFGKDVVFANEWKVQDAKNPSEIIEEVKLTGATGAGITGGDPLVLVDRCASYIRLLKEKFGKNFHIHLYTPLKLVTEERLRKLFDAGLDEIRFHPNLEEDALWNRLELAREFPWKIGIEVPVIPGFDENLRKLTDFITGKVDFINFNELELSDTQTAHYKLREKGFVQKNSVSYGVKGSKELGVELVKYASSKGIFAHLCTARLKDAVQVKQRLIQRADRVALLSDEKTSEGTLIRGCIYLPSLAPGISYGTRLKNADTSKIIAELEKAREALKKTGIVCVLDSKKLRLLLSKSMVQENAKSIKKKCLIPAIVEEYPTADGLEVELEFL